MILALCLIPALCSAQGRSISLDECIRLSHSHNPAVVNAALDSKIARATKQEAMTNWFPTVSASAYGFNSIHPLLEIGLDDVLGSSDAANNLRYYAQTAGGLAGVNTEWSLLHQGYVGSINVAQPIFAGGRIANGNSLATLGVKAAEIKNAIALRDNDDLVVGKYWSAVSLCEKKEALQQAIDLVSSLERDVASARDAGLAKESDLMQVRLKSKELQSQMTKLRSGERLAKMDLFNLIGLDYKILELDGIALEDRFSSLEGPDSHYKDEAAAAASLEESQLLGMAVDAKKLEKKMAVGEGLPQVGIGASVGYGQILGDARTNGAVYAMVKIPISDWSKTSRKIQRCNYEIQKAENDKEYLDKQLVLKLSKEWMDLTSAWDQVQLAGDAVELAELVEAQKQEEYSAGLCTLTELLQSQTEMASARSAYIDRMADYCNALAVWDKE